MLSTTSGQRCIGRRWKNFARALLICRSAKASARSSELICSAFLILICRSAGKVDRPLRGRCLSKWRLRRLNFNIEQGTARSTASLLGKSFSETDAQLLFLRLAIVLQPANLRGELFLE